MSPRQEQLRKYIDGEINSICPYKDASSKRLYLIGFLEAYLACILADDPIMFKEFKDRIGDIKNG